ncbi:MAG TPA: FHA domain-containing protein [Kofleriaceae bacterium]|nr:FHA domain-containing protein [Kofleriaceae bacterium]
MLRLRQWGTDIVYPLPSEPNGELIVGTDEACALRLDDPRVSHQHAALAWRRGGWHLRDLGSKNGLWRDGARHAGFLVAPGIEIKIGRTILIPESQDLIDLLAFLARILGWGADRREAVDMALRSIRAASVRRHELVLLGEGDLVPVAFAIHQRTLGDRPFVVSDPRRADAEESVRSVANRPNAQDAYTAAAGGSLCVRSSRLPASFSSVLPQLRRPDSRVQLIVCAGDRSGSDRFLAPPVRIPPLRDRQAELARIVEEYALEAERDLKVRPGSVDRGWVLEHATGLADIEKAARRSAALHNSASVGAAAILLGMQHVSLTRWLRRRGGGDIEL